MIYLRRVFMAKSVASRNRTSRTKGRQGEFTVREVLAKFFNLQPDDVILRSKSANGCDVLLSTRMIHKFPFSVEVKNRKSIPYFDVVQQTISNTEDGTFPLAFILNEKLGHTCIVPAEVFLAIISIINECVGKDWRSKVLPATNKALNVFPKIRDARINFCAGD